MTRAAWPQTTMTDPSTPTPSMAAHQCGSPLRLQILGLLHAYPKGLLPADIQALTGACADDVAAAARGLRADDRIRSSRRGPGAPLQLPISVLAHCGLDRNGLPLPTAKAAP